MRIDPGRLLQIGVTFSFAVITVACSAHEKQGPDVLTEGDELVRAADGPSASQVAGNAEKWAGSYVKLTCKISNVIQADSDSDAEANAECGKAVLAVNDLGKPSTSNIDYSDPAAVSRAIRAQEKQAAQDTRDMEDSALIVLVGDGVHNYDGNQLLTIVGGVIGSVEGENGMGVKTEFPTIRVDYQM